MESVTKEEFMEMYSEYDESELRAEILEFGKGLDSTGMDLDEMREKLWEAYLRDVGEGGEQLSEGKGVEEIEESDIEFRLIPVALLREATNPLRAEETLGVSDGFVETIKKYGILQSLVVGLEDAEGKYTVKIGLRRLRAAVKAGLIKVPCIVRDAVSLSERLVENMQRQALSPLEEASAMSEMLAEGKYTQTQVAEELGISQSDVSKSISLLNLNKNVQRLVEKVGGMSKDALVEVAAAGDEDAQKKALGDVRDRNVGAGELRKERQAKKTSRGRKGKTPFRYRHKAEDGSYKLLISFSKKDKVSNEEILELLRALVLELEGEIGE